MEVKLAAIADYANVTDSGKLNIMGIFGQLNPPKLPFRLPTMYLVLSLWSNLAEVGSTKDITIRLIGQDGDLVLEAATKTVVSPPALPNKGVSEAASVLMLNNLQFDRPGDYQFCILINGETKETIDLRVNAPEGSNDD